MLKNLSKRRKLLLGIGGGLLGLCLCVCVGFVALSRIAEADPANQATGTARTVARTTGTAQAIALATEAARPTNTPRPTDTPTSTYTPTPVNTPAPTQTLIPETATAAAMSAQATAARQATTTAQTATAEAKAAQNATATVQVAIARQATATAQAIAKATAAIEAYKSIPPKGTWGESVRGITVSIGDFRYQSAGGGMRYVAFGVRVDNETISTIHVNPFNCTLVDLDGATYTHDAETYSFWSNPLPAVDVSPGSHTYGGIVFQIPSNTGPAKFIYRDPSLFGPTIEIDLRRPPDEP